MRASSTSNSISSNELGDSSFNSSGYCSSTQSEPFTSDESQKITLDSIINNYGYGFEVWKILISVFFCFLINGYLTTSLSSFVIPYQDYFSLTEAQISFLGTAFFITKFISSCTIGYQTNLLSRIIIIKLAIFVTFFLVAINAIFLNYPVLMIVQIGAGFAAGIFEIASFNIACEFTPTNYRGWIMISIWNGYNIGVLFPNLIMLFIMPDYKPLFKENEKLTDNIPIRNRLQVTLFFVAIVIFVFGTFCLIFLKDSPRNLILTGKFREAFKILKKMVKKKLTKQMKKDIIRDIIVHKSDSEVAKKKRVDIRHPHTPKEEIAKVSDVFAKGMCGTGILLVFICFFGNCINDGFQLVLNLLLDKIYEGDSPETRKKILHDNILINSICLPSNFFLGIFTEFKFLGRKYTQFLGFIILGGFIAPIIFDKDHAYIYLIFFMFFTCITNMVNVYVAEIYPTKTRDMALGVIQAVGYFGSCISQFLFVFLNKLGVDAGSIAFLALCVLNGLLSLFLKVDTYQRPLDAEEESEEDQYKAMIEKIGEFPDNDKDTEEDNKRKQETAGHVINSIDPNIPPL